MGWLGRVFVGFNVLAAWGLLAYIVSRGFELGTKFTAVELLSLILGALAVMIAVLTVFLAVLALWGYNSLREAAKEIATTVAKDIATTVAKRTAEEVAGRTTRTLQDQEFGQGSGDEYARAAIGHADNDPANGS